MRLTFRTRTLVRHADKAHREPTLKRILCLALLTLVLTSASVPPESAFDLRLSRFIASNRFDWAAWEAKAVLQEVDWWLQNRVAPDDREHERALLTRKEEVMAFLDGQQQAAQLEYRIRNELAQLPQPGPVTPFEQSPILPPSVEPLEQELEELQLRQEAAGSRAERIVAAQVSRILIDQGLGCASMQGWLPCPSMVWPPVTFRFNDMPTLLIISPRDEIRVHRSVYLLPDMPEAERTRLEAAVEGALGVSALVENLGGVGSWPTMVLDNASLHSLVDIIAHEWTHTYLYFRPLGAHYGDSRDLTTMNETAASLVGGEVAELAMARYYPELLAPPVLPSQSPAAAKDVAGTVESFPQAMRRIRLHVDSLLATGNAPEAEAYMEAERQKLVAAGYNLRRLNQAYFAFHGSYATGPASVDPIGPWMRQLRAQSGSLKAFLEQVAEMHNLDDLRRALGESGP